MDPENADEYIRLINKDHPLGKDYIPPDLTEISDTRKDRKAVQMREYAAKALDAMFIEMRAAASPTCPSPVPTAPTIIKPSGSTIP